MDASPFHRLRLAFRTAGGKVSEWESGRGHNLACRPTFSLSHLPTFLHWRLARGAEEDFLQVRVAGLLRELLRDFGNRAVNHLPAIFQNQDVRTDFLNHVEQVRTDDNGRTVPRAFQY